MNTLYGWYLFPHDESRLERAKSSVSAAATPPHVQNNGENGALLTGRDSALHFDPSTRMIVAVAGSPRWEASSGRDAAASAESLGERFRDGGPQAIAGLNGHFALAIIDPEAPSLTLAVDRFGSVPLYFSALPGGGVLFGTRLANIQACAPDPLSVAPQSIYDYVYFHSIPSPSSIYEGVGKLEPATSITVKGRQGPVASPYWQPKFETGSKASIDELAGELKSLLHVSVANSIDGGTYGSFLSGGLDSSTVAGLMAELAPNNAGTFTMGFRHDAFDETKFATVAAEHFGLKMNATYVEPLDIVKMMPRMSSSFDEPFGNSSAIPAMMCADGARDRGVDTLLAGDGGDELFAGNVRYLTQQIFEHYRSVPASLRRLLEAPGVHDRVLPHKVRRYIEQANVPMPDRTQTYNPVEWFTPQRIFDPQFLRSVDTSMPRQRLRERYLGSDAKSLLDKMLYLDWKFTLADNDLVKVSRACEAGGVSVMFPLLDNRLLEFSLKVPSNMKLKPRRLRYFYKHAMRGWLPAEIISKEKHGFGLPFGEWLRTSPELRNLTEECVRNLRARGFIRGDFLDELIALHRSEHAGFFGTMLWVLIALEHWLSARRLTL